MVLVFDLDDTLYEELTYVYSGFQEVAKYLQSKFNLPYEDSLTSLKEGLHTKGRGNVFDDFLIKKKIYSKTLVKRLLTVYRLHDPNINLHVDAQNFIEKHTNAAKYIVTDGNKLVQERKIIALGLPKLVKFSFISRRYGIMNEKPSPYCFNKICKRENVNPGGVIYFGDNPNKDFVGIKPLGFKTIRLLRGNYKDVKQKNDYEAHVSVNSFDEISNNLLDNLVHEKN